MVWLDLALRVAIISQLAFICVLLFRAGWPLSGPRAIALAMCCGVAAYVFLSAPGPNGLTPTSAPLIVLRIANPVLFWLFVCAIFGDSVQPRTWHFAALLAILALGFLSPFVVDTNTILANPWSIIVSRLLAMTFVLMALWVIFRGRPGDLLENRRRLRSWVTAMVGICVLFVLATEIALLGRQPPEFLSILNVAIVLAIAHIACHAMVKVSGQLCDPLVSDVAVRNSLPELQRQLLERLNQELQQRRCYRQEGLTIAELAQRLDTQDYLLRRVINQRLGFRNFNEFLHSYRIREACARLQTIEARKAPILTIALEVGYSSIGPFNRAFRDLTGMTPTEYRQRQGSSFATGVSDHIVETTSNAGRM